MLFQAGIRIAIHQPGERPLMYELGYDVEPGTSTSFALSKVVTYLIALIVGSRKVLQAK